MTKIYNTLQKFYDKPMDSAPWTEISLRWTDSQAEIYREGEYWRDETFVEIFDRNVDRKPDRKVVGTHRRETFGSVREEAEHIAAGLQDLGICPGDVVSFQLPTWVSTVVVHVAISKIGAISNPIVPIYRADEVKYILNDSRSKCLFIPDTYRDYDYREMVAEVEPEVECLKSTVLVGETEDIGDLETTTYDDLASTPNAQFSPPAIDADDPHLLLYTSGTTGDPKGAYHTHNTFLTAVRLTRDILELEEGMVTFMPSPLTHITGIGNGIEMASVGCTDFVMMEKWNAERAVEIIEHENCAFTISATPFLRGIVEEAPEGWDCPLEVFGCGGAEVPPELIYEATEALDCFIYRGYGMTEHPIITRTPRDAPLEKRAETDGRVTPGTDIQTRSPENGEVLDTGERGVIWTHGPQLMPGYYNPELNEEVFDGKWFNTGDIGVLDEDGYLTITGREKDVIIRGGENIPVKEVEDILYEHPKVEDVAVVAMPDPELQERACAYAALADGTAEFTFEEMREFLDDYRIAIQKYPERIEVVDELPMTASGKVKKTDLREDIADKLGREPITR